MNQGNLPIDALSVTGPDGQAVAAQNAAKGRSRGVFDLELRQLGSYRIAVADLTVMALWEVDGKPRRRRGEPADMATGIPARAVKLNVELMQRRVETFVTVGAPTRVKPTAGTGLQLSSPSHPNDLYAGETSKFRFLLDGKPAMGLDVEVIAGGTRYRDVPDEMRFKTNEAGEIDVIWPAAGMYWLGVSVDDENAKVPNVQKRRVSYAGTFEVLRQ